MFRLDNAILVNLGLGDLPADEKSSLLQQIYETLEMRVGMALGEQMTAGHMAEFEGFIDTGDEAGALTWLETNFPRYQGLVADQLRVAEGGDPDRGRRHPGRRRRVSE